MNICTFHSLTDGELKLWCVETGTCLKMYNSHANKTKFVELSVNNGYIACGKVLTFVMYDTLSDLLGSENNSFYVYQKYISQPIQVHNPKSVLES